MKKNSLLLAFETFINKWPIFLKYPILKKIFLFLCGGGTTVFIQLLVFYFLLEKMEIYYMISGTGAFLTGVVYNFFFQKIIVFENNKGFEKQLVYFFINAGINYVLNMSLLYVLVELFGLYPLISQVMIVLILSTYNFLAYSFIFSEKKS